jgi:hypothetical protein
MQARELAERLRLDRSARSWRGSCPVCSYPRAFSVRAGRDGVALTYCANGCTRADLSAAFACVGGGAVKPRHGAEASASSRRQGAALRLWNGSLPALGTPADTYLTARALAGVAASSVLRFRGDTPHPEGGRLPAMVALVVNAESAPVGVHRTYLAADGRGKAKVTPDKASLGPVWGGAIRLANLDADGSVVVGEGIESAASAGQMIGLPAWAAISAGNMAKGLVLPPAVRRVVIAVDPDEASEAAAKEAADRWGRTGLRVQLAHPIGGGDFNDTLRTRLAADAR